MTDELTGEALEWQEPADQTGDWAPLDQLQQLGGMGWAGRTDWMARWSDHVGGDGSVSRSI